MRPLLLSTSLREGSSYRKWARAHLRAFFAADPVEYSGFRRDNGRRSPLGNGGPCQDFRHGRDPAQIEPGGDAQFLKGEA